MIRVLQTSDTHLGRVTAGAPRAADHDAVLAEILEIARQVAPDLILHTGDLFDVPRPPVEEMHRAVAALRDLAVVAPVVVVCGNHESPRLFELFASLLGPGSRITFVSRVKRPEDGAVLDIMAASGQRLRLGALPFVHHNRVAALKLFDEQSDWMASYADFIGQIEAMISGALLNGYRQDKDVLMFAAHLHVAGATWSHSERPVHVSEAYGSHLESIPAVSYAAFGHLHKPQPLPGDRVVGRFVGSPLQMDFGEEGEEKGVVLIEAEPGQRARVTVIPLRSGRRLRRLDGSMEEIAAQREEIDTEILRLTVRTPTHVPDLGRWAKDTFPAATIVGVEEVCSDRRLVALSRRADSPVVDEDFETMFRDFLHVEGTRGASADRVARLFSSLIDAVQNEQLPHFPEELLLAAPGVVGNADPCHPTPGGTGSPAAGGSPGGGDAVGAAVAAEAQP